MRHFTLSLIAFSLAAAVPASADYSSGADLLKACQSKQGKAACAEYMLATSAKLNWPESVFSPWQPIGVSENERRRWSCPPGDTEADRRHWLEWIPQFVADYWQREGTGNVLLKIPARDAVLIALVETIPLCNGEDL